MIIMLTLSSVLSLSDRTMKLRPCTYNLASRRKCNPAMTLLRPNLIFGENSYMIHYLIQAMMTGRVIYPKLTDCKKQKYYPM